jgi:predicted dehydrogenase
LTDNPFPSRRSEPARVAVVGTGSAGSRHLQVFREVGADVVAVPVRAERLAALRQDGWTAAADLASAGAIDVVIIATDTGRHVADLTQALDTDARVVLVEKPLAPARSDLDTFEASLDRVAVGCCFRFDAGLGAFRRLLPQIGALHHVDVRCRSFLPDWRPGRSVASIYAARPGEGGVLLDLVHEIDYATWTFGVPRGLFARVDRTLRLGIPSDDRVLLSWENASGVTVSVGLDYLTRPSTRGIVAYGEGGTLAWDAIMRRVTLYPADGGPAVQVEVGGMREDMYLAQARALLARAGGGDGGDLATGRDGVAVLAVVDAARRSSTSGRVEAVA